MVFAVVAVALIWKRIVKPRATFFENAKPLALIFLLCSTCIGEHMQSSACENGPRLATSGADELRHSNLDLLSFLPTNLLCVSCVSAAFCPLVLAFCHSTPLHPTNTQTHSVCVHLWPDKWRLQVRWPGCDRRCRPHPVCCNPVWLRAARPPQLQVRSTIEFQMV